MRIAAVRTIFLVASLTAACQSELRPPRPGETCWGQEYTEAAGADFCDPQQCFKKDHSFTVNMPSGTGFSCDDGSESGSCKRYVPGDPGGGSSVGISFVEPAGGWLVHLGFNRMLMADGYSLENFRKHLDMAGVSFPVSSEFDSFYASADPLSEVEFVSYEDGLLHVKFEAAATRTHNIITTPTYVCAPLKTCDRASCYYASEDAEGSGESVIATVDIKAPLAPITP